MQTKVIAGLSAVGGLVLGIVLGAASSGEADVTASPEYKALESSAAAAVAKAEADLESVQAGIAGREQRASDRESELADKEIDLEKAKRKLQRLSDDLDARAQDIQEAEGELARRTVSGDGVYRVGADMEPGTYRSVSNVDCYWSINADANGDNIISNNFGNGPAIVTVAAGQFFETSGCSDWIKQG